MSSNTSNSGDSVTLQSLCVFSSKHKTAWLLLLIEAQAPYSKLKGSTRPGWVVILQLSALTSATWNFYIFILLLKNYLSFWEAGPTKDKHTAFENQGTWPTWGIAYQKCDKQFSFMWKYRILRRLKSLPIYSRLCIKSKLCRSISICIN